MQAQQLVMNEDTLKIYTQDSKLFVLNAFVTSATNKLREFLPRRNTMTSVSESIVDRPGKCRIPRPEKSGNNRRLLLRRSNSMYISPAKEREIPMVTRTASFAEYSLNSYCDVFTPEKNLTNSSQALNRKGFESPKINSIACSTGVTYRERTDLKTKFHPRNIEDSFNLVETSFSECTNSNLSKHYPTGVHTPSKKNVCHCQFRYNYEEYLTPTQRCNKELRRLKALLEKTNKELELQIKENAQLKNELLKLEKEQYERKTLSEDNNNGRSASCASNKTSDSGNSEMENISNKSEVVEIDTFIVSETGNNLSELNHVEEDKMRILELENQLKEMQDSHLEQEKQHQSTYLEMYRKGQEAARFEHADEVLEFAHYAPTRVSVPELLKQLHLTEQELNQMKNLYRTDVYNKQAEFCNAEITLRFLKDAIYYFLTDKDSRRHLTAIESIIGFTEFEKMNIQKALLTRKSF